MKSLQKLFRALLFVVLVAGVASCNIKDNEEPCEVGEVELRFQYKFADLPGDTPGESMELSDMVSEMYLYVFEQTSGILIDIFPIDGDKIEHGLLGAELPVGTYTIVAWGFGKNSTTKKGGFRDVHMVDLSTGRNIPMAVGETRLTDFRMLVADSEHEFSDLFHAVAEDIVVTPAVGGTEDVYVDFNFTRYNSTLRITISGIQYINPLTTRAEPHLPLDVFVTGKKGSYTYTGAICSHAPEQRYNTITNYLQDTKTEVDIRLLRLDVSRHSTDPVMLHLHSTNTSRADDPLHILPDLNVLQDAIYKVRDEQGRYLYRTQAEIDRQDIFEMEINILQDLSIEVTVEGFEVHDLEPMY